MHYNPYPIGKYRIKTEKEFIATLGSDWRKLVRAGWNDHMDHLFGKIYKVGQMGWNISDDMLIPVGPLRYKIKPCTCGSSGNCGRCNNTGEIINIVAENDNK